MQVKFKVGDKVKIIRAELCRASCGNQSCPFKGQIGIIKEIKKINIGIHNFDDTGRWCSGFNANMLELVDKIFSIKQYGIVKFLETKYE